MIKILYIARKVLSYKTLDLLCLTSICFVLIYELPATAIAQIGASFGMFETGDFYVFRLKFSAFAIGVTSLNILVNHRYLFRNRFFLLYLFFFTYMLAIIWFNRELYGLEARGSDPVMVSAPEFFFPILFQYTIFFLVGLYLPRLAKSYALLLSCLFIIFFMVVTHINLETLSLDRESYIDSSYLGNYLFLGDATSIIALICIAFLRNIKAKIILTVLSAVALFFIGSRTSFAAFVGTTGLFYIMSFKPRYLAIAAICFIAAGVWLSSNFDELAERNPRMFGVVSDFEDDNSVAGRKVLSEHGWQDIRNNPIMGNFGGQLSFSSLDHKNDVGWRSYMHDVFSYWRQFGIIAFIIIVAFVVRCLTKLSKYSNLRNQRVFALHFLICIFIIVEAAFSRSFNFTYVHIFFGLTVAMSHTLVPENKLRSLAFRYYYYPKKQIFSADRLPRNKRRKKRKRRSRKKYDY